MVLELYHHGIKGQRWGVRRYQNEDGTLTNLGVKRYAIKQYKNDKISQMNEGQHITRSELRKQYKNTSTENNINAAKKFLKDSGYLGIDGTTTQTLEKNRSSIRKERAVRAGNAIIGSAAILTAAAAGKAFYEHCSLINDFVEGLGQISKL